jgi:D-serine deaminase-like pyridoxal phosphate-dependent protein
MEFHLQGFSHIPYKISQPERIPTPRLIVFRDRVAHNIKRMGELLQGIHPAWGLDLLCPHVKTHKSKWATQQLMAAGVNFFKTTPNEVDMLLASRAKKIFIAYPLLSNVADNLFRQLKNSNVIVCVQIGHASHVEALITSAKKNNIPLSYYIDVDVGMHRTGVSPAKALQLYEMVPKIQEFQFAGLHGYDGHNNQVAVSERRIGAIHSMDMLISTVAQFEIHGINVPEVIIGGTPSFLIDLQYLHDKKLPSRITLSPGTWLYSDTQSCALQPHSFEMAACILVQVIDLPTKNTATLNAGHKRWAIDRGPIEVFSVPGMQSIKWNEEHTVVSVPNDIHLGIGDYVLFALNHVCSTVNLWEYFILIDEKGDIADPYCPVEGRNR